MFKKLARKVLTPRGFILAVPLLMIGNHFVSKAIAGDIFAFQLASTDAGATQVAALQAYQTYDIWCQIPSCFKTDIMNAAGTVVGDGGINCTVDMPAQVFQNAGVLSTWNTTAQTANPQTAIPRGRFYSGLHTGIVAYAMDAGNPQCNVSLVYNGQ